MNFTVLFHSILHGVTRLQEVTGDYWRLQGVTRGCRRLQDEKTAQLASNALLGKMSRANGLI